MAGYGAAVPSSRANASGMVSQPPSKVSGLLYGLRLGGFIDGIVLHQILQWHHIVSDVSRYPMNTIAGLEVKHADRRVLSFGDLGSCPGRLHRCDQRLAAGTPGTELEVPLRARPHRLGHLQHRGGTDQPSDTWHPSCAGRSWWAAFLGHRVSDFGVLLIVGCWSLHKAGLGALERRAITTRYPGVPPR
jgi:Predicted membrane protein (DUF2243)